MSGTMIARRDTASAKASPASGPLRREPASAAAGPAAGGGRPSLKLRLQAWWNGLDAEELCAPPPETAGAPASAEPAGTSEPAPDGAAWSESRVKAAELIIGDDCRTPISPDLVVEMLKPLGLSDAKSVLDVAAGLGNAARAVSRAYGAWVTGLEDSETLAVEAMRRSQQAGVAKKVPIQLIDREAFEAPEKPVDCVFGREPFFTVRQKPAFIETLLAALKPGGELVFTDYVLRQSGLDTAAVQEWKAGEPVEPHPWSIEEMIAFLREHQLDVRSTENYSRPFRDLIVGRLEQLVTKSELAAGDPVQAELMLREVELWAGRIKALDSADVQVHRIVARKPADDRGKARAMSNW